MKRAVTPTVSTFGSSTRDPNVPRHVAIVMDGNGRWAKKRFMPRIYGHKHGVDSLVSTIQACAARGVEHLTVFAFSSENWKRPPPISKSFAPSCRFVVPAKKSVTIKTAGINSKIICSITPRFDSATIYVPFACNAK